MVLNERMVRTNIGAEWDRVFEADKWRQEIPALQFPADWQVKIIPPFMFAVVRFTATCGSGSVSVYLDCYDMLGYGGEPYWEIYPDGDTGDPKRFAMDNTVDLLAAIQKSLDVQNHVPPKPVEVPPEPVIITETGVQKRKPGRFENLEIL